MKNLLLGCLLLAPLPSLFAQTTQPWAPDGAHWYFCQGSGFGAPECSGYFYHEVEKDTLVLGVLCKKISGYLVNYQGVKAEIPPEFCWSANDSVYYYSPAFNQFQLRYDFSAEAGDTLLFPNPIAPVWGNPNDTDFLVIVDSITLQMTSGTPLRVFHVRSLDPDDDAWRFYQNRYTERVGGVMLQTPFPSVTIPEIDGFVRCYADNDLQIQYSQENCDYVMSAWFGQKPEWHYGYGNWAAVGVETMRLNTDVTEFKFGALCNEMTRRIRVANQAMPGAPIQEYDLAGRYVYDLNDRVYASRDNGYVCLYDFNLYTGDTLWIPMDDCPGPLGYVITETGAMDIEGKNLRFQRARLLPYPGSWDDQLTLLILERMGAVGVKYGALNEQTGGYFFLDEQYTCFTDPASRDFRCYSDTEIGLYHPAVGTPCDFVVDSQEPTEALQWQIQPNPADQSCTIQIMNTEDWQYRLFSADGRLLRQGSGGAGNMRLDTETLASGWYLLRVSTGWQQAAHPLVVQH